MSYVLGKKSLAELNGVHPKLVECVKIAIVRTRQDFGVHDGLRTVEEQRRNVIAGVSRTMNSKHLRQADGYSHAVDLVPYINGRLRWEWPPIFIIASAMAEAAHEVRLGLIWGGVWDRRFPEDFGNCSPKSLRAMVDGYTERQRKRLLDAGKKPRVFLDGPHFEIRN